MIPKMQLHYIRMQCAMRLKHVTVKYHFGQDFINDGEVQVLKVSTSYNHEEIFAKVLQFTS